MTTWNIVGTSCMDDLGNVRPAVLLESNPAAVIFSGDLHYTNMGTARYMRGVEWIPDVFWREGVGGAPANARSVQRILDRFELWNGDAGLPNWTDFWTRARAMGVPCYWQLDDHDCLGDNWDHTTTVLSNTFPDSGVGAYTPGSLSAPFGQSILGANMTLADVLYIWRMRQQAKRILMAKYMANPLNQGYNGDIPVAMVGTASASDFDIDYFYLDYGLNSEPGGKAFRHIFIDGVSYKARMSDPDNASKTFAGAVQTSWMQSAMLSAKQQGFLNVFLWSTKDIFGPDNNDGMGAYTYWRDNSLLAFKEANQIPLIAISGDKHLGHTSISRKDQGGITDLLVHCSSPFGSRHSTLVQHKELVWAANRADQPVFERVVKDPVNRIIRMQTVDGYDPSIILNEDIVPMGQCLPIQSSRRMPMPQKPRSGYTPTAVTVTASPFTWQNLTGRAVSVVISAGTLTDVQISQDNFTTAYSMGANQRQVLLQRGESLRITHSSTPTMAYFPVLDADER